MIQQIVKANQVTILYISSGHSLCVLVWDKFCESWLLTLNRKYYSNPHSDENNS